MNEQPTNLPFTTNAQAGDDTTVGQVGGNVRRLTAAATLLLGDVVHLSAADTVNKSTTNADYAKFIGVVVGGQSYDTQGRVFTDSTLVGQTAAAANEWVLVQVDGIVYGLSTGSIVAGSTVIPSAATAGRITVAGSNPGYTIGVALMLAGSGVVGRYLIRWGLDEA